MRAGLRRTNGAVDATTGDFRVSRYPRSLGLRLDEAGFHSGEAGRGAGRNTSGCRFAINPGIAAASIGAARSNAFTDTGANADASANSSTSTAGERRGELERRQSEIHHERSPSQADCCAGGATAGSAEDNIRHAGSTDNTLLAALFAGSGAAGSLADAQFGGP